MSNLKYRVLFVCVHNSARSQMAEAFMNRIDSGHFEAESAGFEPGKLNTNVVEVMHELGIDISGNNTRSVFDVNREGTRYDAVITVCDGASAESCPIFPGNVKRIGWSFADPAGFTGAREAILEKIRQVRDEIEKKVNEFMAEAAGVSYWIK